jgi:hypothetical protein
MTTQKITARFNLLLLLILAAAFSRLIPHPFDFTPVGAIALFGAAYFSNKRVAFVVPLLAMWLSDIVIQNTIYAEAGHFWFYPGTFPYNYLAFSLTVPLGFLLLKKIKIVTLISGGIAATVLFFLISNFGCWAGSAAYPQNPSGLLSCYAAGIPFFGNMLAGNLFYSALLFGAFEAAQRKFPALNTAS